MIAQPGSEQHQQALNGTHTRLIELRGGLGAVPATFDPKTKIVVNCAGRTRSTVMP